MEAAKCTSPPILGDVRLHDIRVEPVSREFPFTEVAPEETAIVLERLAVHEEHAAKGLLNELHGS